MASKRRRLNQAGGDPFRLPTDEFDRIPPPVRCDQQFAAAPPPVRYNQHFAAASPPPESEPGDMEDWGEMPLDPSEWGTNEEAPPEAGYWQEDGEEAPPEAGYWQEDGEEAPPEAGYWQEDGEDAPPEAGYWQENGEEAPPEPRGDDEAAPAESDYWDPLAEPGDEAPAVPGELDDGEVAPAELGCCVGGEEVPTEPGDYNDEIPADTADWKGVGDTSTDMVVREDGGETLPQPGGWEDDKEAVSFLLESLTRNQLINLLLSAAASYPGTLAEIHNIADRNPANRNIFVHSLSLCTTDDSLAAAFASYGEIEDCNVVTDKNTGRSKGYGFVLFRHALSARRALSQPQRSIDNQVAVCQLASAGPPQISPNNPFPDKMGRKIYVGNLPWVVDADRLKYFFAQYGEIEEGPLGFDRYTGKCRGYTIFVYRTVEGAQKAIEVPQKTYLGRRIYCRMAQSKSKISASYANANAPPNAQSSRGGYNQPGNDGPPPGYNGSAYGGDGPPGFSDSGYGSDQHPGCNGGYDESVYGGPPPGFEGYGYGGAPHKGSGYGGAPHKGSGYGGTPPSFNTSGYDGAPPNGSGYDGPPPGYNSSGYGGPPPGFNGYVHVGPGGPPLGFNGSGHGCPPPDMMHAAQQSPMMAMEMLRMGVQPPGQALSSNAMLAGAWQNPTASGFMPNMFASAVRGPGRMQGMPPYAVPPTDPVQGFGTMNAVYQNAGFQGPPGFSDIPYQGGGGGSYQGGEVGSYQGGGGCSVQGGGGGSYQGEDGGSYQGGGGGSNQGGGGGSYQGGEGGAYQDGPMGHGQIANPPAGPMGEYRSQEGSRKRGSRKRHHSPL